MAMSAMEDLVASNNIIIRVMSTVPAWMSAYTTYHFSRKMYYALFAKESREEVYETLQYLALDIERALNTWMVPDNFHGMSPGDGYGGVGLQMGEDSGVNGPGADPDLFNPWRFVGHRLIT